MKPTTHASLLLPSLLLSTGTLPASAEPAPSPSLSHADAPRGGSAVQSTTADDDAAPSASGDATSTEFLDESAKGRNLDRQRDAGFDARFGLGFALPALSSTFTDAYTVGYQGALELGYQLGPSARYHLALAAAHSRFFLDDPSFAQGTASRLNAGLPDGSVGVDATNVDVDGGALPTTELLAQLRWDMATGDWRPYLLGAAGAALFFPRVARFVAPVPSTEGGREPSAVRGEHVWEDDVAPVLSAGVGLTDPTGPFALFAQLRFSWAPGSEASARWISVTVGAEL